MDKLIIKVYRTETKGNEQGAVKITPAAMEKLIEIQRQSGLPLRQIASKLIEHFAEFIDVVEV